MSGGMLPGDVKQQKYKGMETSIQTNASAVVPSAACVATRVPSAGPFLSTIEKSPLSKPAQVMSELGLTRVVYFVLRGGTEDQREKLHQLIYGNLVCRIPLRRAGRQMIICRTSDIFTDQAYLLFYRKTLQSVFGEKCRITVRVMRLE